MVASGEVGQSGAGGDGVIRAEGEDAAVVRRGGDGGGRPDEAGEGGEKDPERTLSVRACQFPEGEGECERAPRWGRRARGTGRALGAEECRSVTHQRSGDERQWRKMTKRETR